MFDIDENDLLEKNTTLSSTARPIRIAYFIEDNEYANSILDEVFAECYGRWGGIDTLIIPFKQRKMRPAYWEWLCSFDPDLIYSYVSLSDQVIQKIHYKLLPAYFLLHPYESDRSIEEQRLSPRFGMEIRALSSFGLIPFYNLRGTIFRLKIEAVIDAYPQWKDDGFLADNFGFASRSTHNSGFPLDRNVIDYVGTYLLTPEDAPENRWRWKQNPKTIEVNSANEVLKTIAKKQAITSVAQLSNALINGPYAQHNSFPSISIVVGDTFNDRVLFWNSRLLRQNHETDMHFCGFRIPTKKFEDEAFIEALNEFFKWRHDFAGYDHRNKSFTLRSISLNTKDLKKCVEQFKDSQHWYVKHEKLKSLDIIVPKKDKFPRYTAPNQDVHVQEVHRRRTPFNPPYPMHLSEISNVPPSLKVGIWYADTKILRHNNHAFAMNVSHWWKLPRREELIRLFMRVPSNKSRLEGRIKASMRSCVS